MGTVSYLTIDGEIVSETRDGVERDYLPDSLGSTIGLLDSTQTLTDTWTYWPYGEVASRTGANPTPMQFVGTLGCHQDSPDQIYMRARVEAPDLGRWLTVDPLWPDEALFCYAGCNPVGRIDPLGKCSRRSQKSIQSCLQSTPGGYNCIPGHGCPQPGHSVDIATAMCVFYYESRLCDVGGPADNGGGLGQLTGGPIKDLSCSGCNKGVTGKGDTTGDGWCAGAQAAYMWMQCRGLSYPGGYGNRTYGPPNNGTQKILACAKCVRAGGTVLSCGGRFIGEL